MIRATMSVPRPRIYFFSRLDSPAIWRDALAAQLGNDRFDFIVGPDCAAPHEIDIGLMYSLPPDGLLAFRNLRAVLSLSAGINQFDRERMPAGVPLARSVDSALAQHMVCYARAAVYRYHRRFHRYERASRESTWRFELPRLNRDTVVGVLGLGELGRAVAEALAGDGFQVHGWSRARRDVPGIRTHGGAAAARASLLGASRHPDHAARRRHRHPGNGGVAGRRERAPSHARRAPAEPGRSGARLLSAAPRTSLSPV